MYQNDYRRDFRQKKDFGPRKNEYIRAQEVRVIGPEGENFGVMQLNDALAKAKEYELDLVEVGAEAKPPVCKIIDFAKYQYELNKKQKKSKSKSKPMKEFRFSPVIADHDLEVRVRRAKEYLDQGHPVRITMRRKGRQTHEQAMATFNEILTKFSDYSTIDTAPKTEGRQITITLKSDGKTKNKKNSGQENKNDQSEGKQEGKSDVQKDSTTPPQNQEVIKSQEEKSE